MVLRGEAEIEGERIGPDTMLYLGSARSSLEVSCLVGPTQLLLIGGKPFEEEILLRWNFVARSLAEIEAATLDWNSRARRFGEVTGSPSPRVTAPSLAGFHIKQGQR